MPEVEKGIREKIIDKIEDSLKSLLKANGYNFDAGEFDEEKQINKVLSDYKSTKDLNNFPWCYARLDESSNEEVGNGTKKKVSTYSIKTVDCFLGIAVSSDSFDYSLKKELEKAVTDLEAFVNNKRSDGTKGLRLYEIPEVLNVSPPVSTPYYDNGNNSGWAVTLIKIQYKDFN